MQVRCVQVAPISCQGACPAGFTCTLWDTLAPGHQPPLGYRTDKKIAPSRQGGGNGGLVLDLYAAGIINACRSSAERAVFDLHIGACTDQIAERDVIQQLAARIVEQRTGISGVNDNIEDGKLIIAR